MRLTFSVRQHELSELTVYVRDALVARVLCQQLARSSLLDCAAVLHDDDEVVVDDRLDAVRNRDDAALAKSLTNLLLDEFICLQVNVCCCLVQDKDACSLQDCPCQAQQLLLS